MSGLLARTRHLRLAVAQASTELEVRAIRHRRAAELAQEQLHDLEVEAQALVTAERDARELIRRRWDRRRAIREVRESLRQLDGCRRLSAPSAAVRVRGDFGHWQVDKLMRELQAAACELPRDFTGSGVYLLWKDDELVYVGQSVNIAKRLGTHAGQKEFTHVAYLSVPEHLLDRVERAFLDAFVPPLNTDPKTSAIRRQRMDREARSVRT